MIDPPNQWKEMFIILQIAKKPVLSAIHWHEQHRFSSNTAPLLYTDLADYLSLLQPVVNRKTNELQMLPTVFHLKLKNRISLLCFLKEIFSSIPKTEQLYLISHLQNALNHHTCSTSNYYFKLIIPQPCVTLTLVGTLSSKLDFLKDFNSDALYEKLDESTKMKMQVKEVVCDNLVSNSAHQEKVHENSTSNDERLEKVRATKRLLKDDSHQQVDIKKIKLLAESVIVEDVDLTITVDYQEEFKTILEKSNPEVIIDYFSKNSDKLSNDLRSSEISEEMVTEILEKAEQESQQCCSKVLEFFVVPYLSTISKPVKQGLFSICKTISKNCPDDAITHLLEPLIAKVTVLNRAHASFIVSCLKLVQNNELKCNFLVSILNRCDNQSISNEKEKEKETEAVVQVLNYFITLPLDQQHLHRIISFFIVAITEHPSLFSLSKLMLVFVKKFALKLKNSDESGLIEELGAVIPMMKSSLSKVCLSTFNKLVK